MFDYSAKYEFRRHNGGQDATYPNCWKLLKTLLLNWFGNIPMGENKLVYSENAKYDVIYLTEIDNQQPSL